MTNNNKPFAFIEQQRQTQTLLPASSIGTTKRNYLKTFKKESTAEGEKKEKELHFLRNDIFTSPALGIVADIGIHDLLE